ncbi:hypothetical protein EL22_25365 [Halostagnicola sp. A56]|uniref:hypothetical protein n=1 Tax=Halostagnicola sp. A56 TaxID=1495067 RepID=UPI00049EFC90|nr:hypothetical protein [Halostagnicola sp. A56]KDE56700.1 hypothetical protein EL22_25365 [Halostagnicola sp. A56]
MKDRVLTDIGTTVVETPKRIENPVTGRTEDLTNLSKDGYCRRFLAHLSASNSPDVIDLSSSPVLTFDKDRWEIEENGGAFVLVKREAEGRFGEKILGNYCTQDTDTDRSEDGGSQ